MICKEMMQAKQHFLSSAASYNQPNINLMAHLIHCTYSHKLNIISIFLVNNSKIPIYFTIFELEIHSSYQIINPIFLNLLKHNKSFNHVITRMHT